jgi:hypothetical protein
MKSQSQRPESGRRSFLRRSGAVVSAMLVPAAAGIAHAETGNAGTLEDAAAIRKLYQEYAAGLAQAGPGQGTTILRLVHEPGAAGETITLAPDRRSATATFACLAQIAVPLGGSGSLVDMARLQGQHARTWWENGIHELECARTAAGWQIRRLEYRKTAGPAAPVAG